MAAIGMATGTDTGEGDMPATDMDSAKAIAMEHVRDTALDTTLEVDPPTPIRNDRRVCETPTTDRWPRPTTQLAHPGMIEARAAIVRELATMSTPIATETCTNATVIPGKSAREMIGKTPIPMPAIAPHEMGTARRGKVMARLARATDPPAMEIARVVKEMDPPAKGAVIAARVAPTVAPRTDPPPTVPRPIDPRVIPAQAIGSLQTAPSKAAVVAASNNSTGTSSPAIVAPRSRRITTPTGRAAVGHEAEEAVAEVAVEDGEEKSW